MKFYLVAVCLLIGVIAEIGALNVNECPGSKTKRLGENAVKVNTCTKFPCRLRRKTTASFEITFTPETDIKSLTTSVHAQIGELPLPFIGVDGTSACENIFAEDGKTKVKCPLKAGTTYVYRNMFPILEVYPKLSLTVHWALTSKNKDVLCFEVPAKIV